MQVIRSVWYPVTIAGSVMSGAAMAPFLTVPLALVSGLFLIDATARFRDYTRLRASIRRNGPEPDLYRQFMSSRCQREALIAAASAEGYGSTMRHAIRQRGYRWWHLIPDGAFSENSPVLTGTFWRAVFGVRGGRA